MYSNPCPAAWGDDADFDPYMCGDDLVLPKQAYANALEFINTFKPPGLDDFTFVEVDDEKPTWSSAEEPCWIARTYSNSAGSASAHGSWLSTAALVAAALAMQRAVRSYQRGLCPPEQLFQPTSFTLKYRGPRSARGAKRAEALTGVVP